MTSSPVSKRVRLELTIPFLVENVTVSNLLQRVQDRGLQFYRFNDSGNGCLFWNLELLRMLVEFGWVNPHTQQKLEDKLESWHKINPGQKTKMPSDPPHRGRFIKGPL